VSRLSNLSNQKDFEVELQRERLRRMQWRRWEQLLLTVGIVVAIVASSMNHPGLVTEALRWLA